jgi:hypothetical protein
VPDKSLAFLLAVALLNKFPHINTPANTAKPTTPPPNPSKYTATKQYSGGEEDTHLFAFAITSLWKSCA